MRISDWSSDVCSSDLVATGRLVPVLADARSAPEPIWAVYPKRRHLQAKIRNFVDILEDKLPHALERPTFGAPPSAVSSELTGQLGRASCRERGWQYVEISVVAVSLKKQTQRQT